jgi:hypothetical protein
MLGLTESISIELMAKEGYPVSTYVHAVAPIPPVVDFHKPPEAAPIYKIEVSVG